MHSTPMQKSIPHVQQPKIEFIPVAKRPKDYPEHLKWCGDVESLFQSQKFLQGNRNALLAGSQVCIVVCWCDSTAHARLNVGKGRQYIECIRTATSTERALAVEKPLFKPYPDDVIIASCTAQKWHKMATAHICHQICMQGQEPDFEDHKQCQLNRKGQAESWQLQSNLQNQGYLLFTTHMSSFQKKGGA